MGKGTVVLVMALIGLVIAAGGCMGSEKPSETPQGTHSSGPSMTQTAPTTSTSHATETHSASSSPGNSQTDTETETTSTEAVQKLTWASPWEYSPIRVDGREYVITHYVVLYEVRPNETSPLYRYRIEKSEEVTNLTVYGRDFYGSKVKVGTFKVYEYRTVITPINAAVMKGDVTIKVWYTERTSEAFIYPWDIGWAAGSGTDNVVGFEVDYGNESLIYTNPLSLGKSTLPYIGGNQNLLDELNPDLMNLYYGWFAVLNVGIWADWSVRNLLVPQSGTWRDYFGNEWSWKTRPAGTVRISGIEFKTVEGEWSYLWNGTRFNGTATVAPKIFIPLEVRGEFTYVTDSGLPETIYGHFKVEEMTLSNVR
jgi:hypothetical protein